jgi:SAM-dependent methyltransferase
MPSARGPFAGPSPSLQGVAYHQTLAAGWNRRYLHGGFRRRAAFVVNTILPLTPRDGDWIDVGCGSGYFSRILARRGARVLGIDGSAAMIEAAHAVSSGPPHPRYELGMVESLAGRAARFDGVLCLSVLEYLDNPDASFGAMARMLRPGGCLIASAPNRNARLRRLQLQARRLASRFGFDLFAYLDSSKNTWSRWDFSTLAAKHGLSCQAIMGFDPVTPRLFWAIAPPSLLFLICRRPAGGEA